MKTRSYSWKRLLGYWVIVEITAETWRFQSLCFPINPPIPCVAGFCKQHKHTRFQNNVQHSCPCGLILMQHRDKNSLALRHNHGIAHLVDIWSNKTSPVRVCKNILKFFCLFFFVFFTAWPLICSSPLLASFIKLVSLSFSAVVIWCLFIY